MIRLTLKTGKSPEEHELQQQNIPSISYSQIDEQQQHQQQPIIPKLRLNLGGLASTIAATTTVSLPPITGVEEHFILRLPPSLASILNSELSENDYSSPGDLSITFVSGRTAVVKHPRFIKERYPAVLMDSPTIMETFKSSTLSISSIQEATDEDPEDLKLKTDSNSSDIYVGQYYKVADLNQILMVLDLDTIEGQRTFNRIPDALQEQLLKALQGLHPDNKNLSKAAGMDDLTATWSQWPDGLTPPMKSANQRKFANRPLHASAVGDLERIEREVERLLKSDGQAIESKFTLFGIDGEVLLGDGDFLKNTDDDDHQMDQDLEALDEEDEVLESDESEVGSSNSASDIEDMNDFAAEIEDNLLETNIPAIPSIVPAQTTIDPVSTSLPISSDDQTIILVKDLEAKLAEKQKQAESVSNPLIKARIEDVIRQMEDNLKNLREKS